MKISFVIDNLMGGGAERVLALIANEFTYRNHEVTIITYSPECVYTVDKDILLKPIFAKSETKIDLISRVNRKLKFIPRLFYSMKNEDPDVIISFMMHTNRIVIPVSKLLGIPVIATEHTIFQLKNSFLTWEKSFIAWITRRWIYKMADAITVLTNYDYKNYYSHFLGNVSVMPNPVSFAPIEKSQARDKIILAAGELDRWTHKGFDNLLTVFSQVVKIHPEWKLKIAGSGENGKKYLTDIANELDIINNIVFLGFCQNLDEELKKSSIFVLSSRWEAFGMVLAEAMSQGCACVSFDCVSGPKEIIKNGVDGILVEDQNMLQMEKEICRLIEDEKLREYLAENAVRNIQRLSIQNIGDKWVDLVSNVRSRYKK